MLALTAGLSGAWHALRSRLGAVDYARDQDTMQLIYDYMQGNLLPNEELIAKAKAAREAQVAAGHAAPDPQAVAVPTEDDAARELAAQVAKEVAEAQRAGRAWDESDDLWGAEEDEEVVDDGEEGEEGSTAAAAAGQQGMSSTSELLGTQILRLHGKLTQAQRTHIFNQFRELKRGVLLCTDVAARGLNLQGVHWIVQYDLPQDPKEYVHRVGRAARLGQRGRAVLFLNPSEVCSGMEGNQWRRRCAMRTPRDCAESGGARYGVATPPNQPDALSWVQFACRRSPSCAFCETWACSCSS